MRGKGGSTKTDKVHRRVCGKTRMRKKARADYNPRAKGSRKVEALLAVTSASQTKPVEEAQDGADHCGDVGERGGA